MRHQSSSKAILEDPFPLRELKAPVAMNGTEQLATANCGLTSCWPGRLPGANNQKLSLFNGFV